MCLTRLILVFLLLTFLSVPSLIIAQQAPHLPQAPRAHSENQQPRPTTQVAGDTQAPQFKVVTREWTTIEIVLSIVVLLFGAIVLALQTILIVKLPLEWTPNSILRFNCLTLIITGGILLVTAGYSNEQMVPVIGLLGTIAGYLLGAGDKPSKSG